MRLDAFLKLPSVKHLVEGDERSPNPMPNHYAAEVNKLVGKKPGEQTCNPTLGFFPECRGPESYYLDLLPRPGQ